MRVNGKVITVERLEPNDVFSEMLREHYDVFADGARVGSVYPGVSGGWSGYADRDPGRAIRDDGAYDLTMATSRQQMAKLVAERELLGLHHIL